MPAATLPTTARLQSNMIRNRTPKPPYISSLISARRSRLSYNIYYIIILYTHNISIDAYFNVHRSEIATR